MGRGARFPLQEEIEMFFEQNKSAACVTWHRAGLWPGSVWVWEYGGGINGIILEGCALPKSLFLPKFTQPLAPCAPAPRNDRIRESWN